MAARGEYNIGHFAARNSARLLPIGFGTDRGTVAAASDWDGPMEVKMRPAGTEL